MMELLVSKVCRRVSQQKFDHFSTFTSDSSSRYKSFRVHANILYSWLALFFVILFSTQASTRERPGVLPAHQVLRLALVPI